MNVTLIKFLIANTVFFSVLFELTMNIIIIIDENVKLIINLALNKKMSRELKRLTKKVDRLESKLAQLQVAQNARSGQVGFIESPMVWKKKWENTFPSMMKTRNLRLSKKN